MIFYHSKSLKAYLASSLQVVSIACVACLALAPGQLIAQNHNLRSEKTFEVASIRQSHPEARNRGLLLLLPRENIQPQSSLFSANAPLASYIIFAYNTMDATAGVEMARKLPSWTTDGMWDIEARADHVPSRDELREMVKNLLIERFKLKAHYEDKRLPSFALVLAKHGKPAPGLNAHPSNSPCVASGAVHGPDSSSANTCRTLTGFDASGHVHVKMTGVTIDQFASTVSGLASGHTIVNRTGLQGLFDINLVYILPPPENQTGVGFPSGQLLEEALEKQLGLKFVNDTALVRVLMVDHIEVPSPN